MAASTSDFPDGISACDGAQTSAVVWRRAVETGALTFEISTDPLLQHVVKTRKVVVTDPTVPVKVEFDNLKPGQDYYYRATDASGDVIEGHFETAAPLGTHVGFNFGVVGDWRAGIAPYVAIKNAAALDLDLLVKLGDTIYADFGPAPANTLEEFRLKHADVYSDHLGANYFADLQATTSVLAVIDDADVRNDFAGGAPPSTDPLGRFAGQGGTSSTRRRFTRTVCRRSLNTMRSRIGPIAGPEMTASTALPTSIGTTPTVPTQRSSCLMRARFAIARHQARQTHWTLLRFHNF